MLSLRLRRRTSTCPALEALHNLQRSLQLTRPDTWRLSVTKAPRLNSAKSTEFSFGSAAQYYINNKAKPKWKAFSYCSWFLVLRPWVCRNWKRFVGIESVNPYRSSARYFDEIVLSSSIRGHHRKSYVGIHIVAVENPTNHNYPP